MTAVRERHRKECMMNTGSASNLGQVAPMSRESLLNALEQLTASSYQAVLGTRLKNAVMNSHSYVPRPTASGLMALQEHIEPLIPLASRDKIRKDINMDSINGYWYKARVENMGTEESCTHCTGPFATEEICRANLLNYLTRYNGKWESFQHGTRLISVEIIHRTVVETSHGFAGPTAEGERVMLVSQPKD